MENLKIEKIMNELLTHAPNIFSNHPVILAYIYGSYATGLAQKFSDLDVCIYVEKVSPRQCRDLEMSIALELDEKLGGRVCTDVRIMNMLPLVITGKVITEGVLIFSKNESFRVDYETSLRNAYFDFLPVLRKYQNEYVDSIIS